MKTFETRYAARTAQMADDDYNQDEIELTLNDIAALQSGKALYHHFDGKSCVITLTKD